VRRTLIVCCGLALGVPSTAAAAPPAISASASAGAAPLAVTLTSDVPAHWEFGDGSSADGTSVEHAFAAGAWTVTASAGGESATLSVRSEAVALGTPRSGRYGTPHLFTGSVVPAAAGTAVALYAGDRRVALARTKANGGFRIKLAGLRSPGPYVAKTSLAASEPQNVSIHPSVVAEFEGSGARGRPLAFAARVRPAGSGTLHVRVWKAGKLVVDRTRSGVIRAKLDTSKSVQFRASVQLRPAAGFTATSTRSSVTVFDPLLQLGSRGAGVRALEEKLAAMHYALRSVDGAFGTDTYEAVLAFQKVHGLPRTGRVDGSIWQRIATATTPRARYGGNHVEVDKARQVLFEVRNGKVVLAVHVSTGATGNTPIGRWQVYRRVTGFDWVLYYPTYFLRGFAIHGYPDVPPYPASHGCVRVPMWIAQRLYAMDQYGDSVYVYA
jgi:peptidoglycan hydrolase-like protein with peptidoglycan-binding domain